MLQKPTRDNIWHQKNRPTFHLSIVYQMIMFSTLLKTWDLQILIPKWWANVMVHCEVWACTLTKSRHYIVLSSICTKKSFFCTQIRFLDAQSIVIPVKVMEKLKLKPVEASHSCIYIFKYSPGLNDKIWYIIDVHPLLWFNWFETECIKSWNDRTLKLYTFVL